MHVIRADLQAGQTFTCRFMKRRKFEVFAYTRLRQLLFRLSSLSGIHSSAAYSSLCAMSTGVLPLPSAVVGLAPAGTHYDLERLRQLAHSMLRRTVLPTLCSEPGVAI
jgi:hypothetical protein